MIVKQIKQKYGDDVFHKNEFFYTMIAGAISGGLAAAVTNPMEVIVVHKQTNPEAKLKNIISEMYKKEGLRPILTKGIGARVSYMSA